MAAEPVTDLERGKVIHLLRQQWFVTVSSGGNGTWGRYSVREKSQRMFTDEKIAALLGINKATLVRCATAYASSIQGWDEGKIVRAVVAYAKKNGRFPRTKADFRGDETLPSIDTWRRAGGESCLGTFLRVEKNVRSLPASSILTIQNVTLRSAALEAFGGIERVVKKGGALVRQQDDFGKLWELPAEPDVVEDVALWLEVTNATAVDGKREHFFLRVPPEMKTAKEAVEWSFGVPTGELEEFAAQT